MISETRLHPEQAVAENDTGTNGYDAVNAALAEAFGSKTSAD